MTFEGGGWVVRDGCLDPRGTINFRLQTETI